VKGIHRGGSHSADAAHGATCLTAVALQSRIHFIPRRGLGGSGEEQRGSGWVTRGDSCAGGGVPRVPMLAHSRNAVHTRLVLRRQCGLA
jgi:hypothetical protein